MPSKKTRKASPKAHPDNKSLSPPHWWLRILPLLLPFLLVAALEGSLRLFDYGRDLSIFRTARANPDYWQINPQMGMRYFPVQGISPAVALTDLFRKEKAQNGLRIFVLGGSSAAGYPYLYNGSFPSYLEVILQARFPDREVEVVNLGMTAVASYTVRDLALKLAPYQPDMLLVYSGHNEFYGALGAGSSESLGNSRWLVKSALYLSDFKIYQLLTAVIAGSKSWWGASHTNNSSTLMERMVANRAIAYGSPVFYAAAENLEKNLIDVAGFCREQEIPLFVGTLVSNIADQSPFVDVFESGQPQSQWQALVDQAKNSYGQDPAATKITLRAAIEIDSMAASAHFQLGRLLLQEQHFAAASKSLYRAKELDGLRFRASEILNDRLHKLAAGPGIHLVTIRQDFEKASPGGIPGRSLMLEHLHPNDAGYRLMARSFAASIIKHLQPSSPPGLPPDSLLEKKSGVTPIDHEVARIRIDYLMSGWPFRAEQPPPAADYQIAGASPIQKLALDFWRDKISWEKMHVQAAQHYLSIQQWELAANEYRALIRATPMNSSPYTLLASLLSQNNRYDEALPVYLSLARLEPSVKTFKMIGGIYLQRGEVSAGLPWLRNALAADAGNREVRFLLAQGLAMAGDWQDAQKQLQTLLQQQPGYPGAAELLQMINQQQ